MMLIDKLKRSIKYIINENNEKESVVLPKSLYDDLVKLLESGDGYFISEPEKYIFALTNLDGEKRAELLGISEDMYMYKNKAKQWRDSIASKIHPDKCSHPDANKAMMKLNELYNSMKNASDE